VRLTDNQLIALFTDLLGVDNVVLFDRLIPNLHQRIVNSLTPDSLSPACVLYPQTIAELSKVIALTSENRLRVLPCGNATKLDWGGLVSRADVVISTSKFNRVIEHCVGDLTVTVEAGVKYQDLQTVLAKAGQFLAINPPYRANATIGGILATASAGSLRHRYNSVPLPEYTQIVVVTGTAETIAQAQQKIGASVLTPTACDLLSANAIADLGLGQGIGLVLQFASLKASVIEQCDRIAVLAKELNLEVQMLGTAEEFWELLEIMIWQEELRNADQSEDDASMVCKLGVLPSASVPFLQECEQIFDEQSHYLQIHAGSGLGVLRLEDVLDLNAIALQIAKVRSIAESCGGFLSILEAPQSLKFNNPMFERASNLENIWGYHGNARDIMLKIQQQFDPNGLLSCDRLYS